MFQSRKISLFFILFSIIFFLISGCVQTQEKASVSSPKKSVVKPKKQSGKLITAEGLKFHYQFFPTNQKAPSVIYIPGLGSKFTYASGSGGYALASPLNKANFNYIGFDRSDALSSWEGQRHALRLLAKRSQSGSTYFPSFDGKNSSAESIVRNEVSSIIEFIEKSPTHDSEKGIYLIGASMGSWLSLVTVHSFPNKIKGVVFLSPAILPEWVSKEEQAKSPKRNIVNYFKSLTDTFGQRPALAIGNKKDIIAPPKTGSALDCALLLRNEIGSNVEVLEVPTSLHAGRLISDRKKIREKIVIWLREKAGIN